MFSAKVASFSSFMFLLAISAKVTGVDVAYLDSHLRLLFSNSLDLWPLVGHFLATIIVILSVTWIGRWYLNYRRVYHLIEKIPGPPVHPIPFLGHAGIVIDLDRSKSTFGTYALIYQMLSGIYSLYGQERLLRMWLGCRPFVILFEPEAVEAVLSSNSLVEKSVEYSWLKPWLGNGLVTSSRFVWKSRRKILTPAFHFKILQDFIPIMNEQSDILVRKITRLHKDGLTNPVNDVLELVTLCTLDTICETAMGVSVNAQGMDSVYVKSLHQVSKLIIYRLTRPWLWPDLAFAISSHGRRFKKCLKIMQDFTREVIEDRKKEWIANNGHLLTNGQGNESFDVDSFNGGKRRLAFLDLLLYQHLVTRTLTIDDVRDEVDTFMFAGHDTTAMAIAWTIYMLGLHSDIQGKVREEVDAIFDCDNNNDVSDVNRSCPLITEDMMRKMKFMDCVLKEVQRVYPTAPFIARELTEDTVISGYLVPKGTSAGILTFLLHQNPKVFPNPQRFDPSRFLPENTIGRHPFAYVPFSAGPRNCIGQKFAQMEQKIVLSSLVRNFVFQSIDPRDKLIVVGEMVLRPVSGIRVIIEPRSDLKASDRRSVSDTSDERNV